MAENLKQLLLQRSEWFAREIMKEVRTGPYGFLTPAQSRLLAHMGGKPSSMAELARRLAISRQAVHKTVVELVRRGILEVRVDPQRRNSRLVVYTDEGRALNRAGAAVIARTEAKIARKIGATDLRRMRELLAQDWD
ncbi:MAG: helix-turn-helix domain-containing protein [Burkholderiaceae bacterium]